MTLEEYLREEMKELRADIKCLHKTVVDMKIQVERLKSKTGFLWALIGGVVVAAGQVAIQFLPKLLNGG